MAGYAKHHDDFSEAGVRLVALTAEDEDGARKMKQAEDLDFDILYGLDVDDMETRYGIHVERGDPTHLQPAQFVLDTEGCVVLASSSTGRVGRLDAEEALEVVNNDLPQAVESG